MSDFFYIGRIRHPEKKVGSGFVPYIRVGSFALELSVGRAK